uniref:Uncharacterized protein n=1 Tax=Hippocampus comes TaxID=109280 RepID=A0A3Q2Y0W9_HIPCM
VYVLLLLLLPLLPQPGATSLNAGTAALVPHPQGAESHSGSRLSSHQSAIIVARGPPSFLHSRAAIFPPHTEASVSLAGVVLPSLSSLPYLLSFQLVCTWWAWSGSLPPLLFRALSPMSLAYSGAHFLLVYSYQLPSLQEAWPPSHPSASLFGLVPLVSADCAAPWRMRVNPRLGWFHFVSPLTLVTLYHVVAGLRRNQVIVLSDEVIGDEVIGDEVIDVDVKSAVTAERRRELWRTAHGTAVLAASETVDARPNGASGTNGVRHGTERALNSSDFPPPVRAADTLETCAFEGDAAGWGGEDAAARGGSGAASAAFGFLLKQSYIGALVAMMAWSITYVSWLTCALLLWSCTLWMMRERRRYTLASSPWLVAYGNLLLVLQYVFSFAAVRQLPGLFPKKDDPCRELASKLVCLLTFWLLLRQARTEKTERQEDGRANSRPSAVCVRVEGEASSAGGASSFLSAGLPGSRFPDEEKMEAISYEKALLLEGGVQMDALLAAVTGMFVKYWIYVCGTMFFFVSFEGQMVLYKVIYMVMFLCCVALYQLNYEKWRAWLRGFWVAVVVYSMLVLFLVYTFQFPSSLHTWTYYTGLSTHRLEDLGLQKFSVPVLFTRIFIPTAFLLVCIVHLHYFHEPFLRLTDLKTVPKEEWGREEEEEEVEEGKNYAGIFEGEILGSWRLVVDRLSVLFLRLLLSLQRLQRLLWWLLELHILKIVSSYMIWMAVKEVCVFNLLFVVCVAVALPCRAWRPPVAGVCTVWTCTVAICKMLYQLNIPGNASTDVSTSVLYAAPIDPAQWVGLRKYEGKLLDYLRHNLMTLALLAFEVTVYRHQELYRLRCNKVPPRSGTLFRDISRHHLDQSVLSCAKYFLNYVFYKFGLEICFLLAVNVIGQRMDLFAVGHALGLICILSRRSRKRIGSVWPKYCYFLSALLCLQYLLCIGFPPAACKDYPWRPPTSNMDSNVVKWLFLKRHCLQVFEDERDAAVRALAGDNGEVDVEDRHVWDPVTRLHLSAVPDFMLCRSYLDMMKVIIFSYMFWFVLTITFITGTTRISIFCMGYLVACFYFLLVGGDLLLKPVGSILLYWDCLIGYNVFVIAMKNILSILACGFIKSLVVDHCWLVQLFSLASAVSGFDPRPRSQQCELPSDEAGIIWDGVCFCFLLLQRRVFRSHYFLYVVLDLSARSRRARRRPASRPRL